MKTEIIKGSGSMKYRKTESGTCYHEETPDAIIEALERLRVNQHRIRLFYGDVETGRDWMEEYEVMGTIGRSGGTIKIPLLIKNARSLGGGGILDHCIVRLIDMATGHTLYQHPKYQMPDAETLRQNVPNMDEEKQKKYIAYMQGKRFSKA